MKTLEERIIEKMRYTWTYGQFDSWLPKLREAIREHETEQLNKPVVSGSCDHKEVISVRHAYKCSKCGELLV